MVIATFAGVLAASNRQAYCGNKYNINALRCGNKHTGVLCAYHIFIFRITNFKNKK